MDLVKNDTAAVARRKKRTKCNMIIIRSQHILRLRINQPSRVCILFCDGNVRARFNVRIVCRCHERARWRTIIHRARTI